MKNPFRPLSRISFRLLAFNLLLVFLPAAGVLILDTYERHLLAAQERTMGQEGRLLAAAVAARGDLEPDHVQRILVQLGQRHQARLRIVNRAGAVIADSALLGPRREDGAPIAASAEAPPQDSLLYRIGSLPFRLLRGSAEPADDDAIADGTPGTMSGAEVRAALEGRYGAATRIFEDVRRTVILFIAIPIRIDGVVEGAVVVSQSTSRIMSALYAVRLDVFRVFLASFGVAVVLTLLVATTIARPLARLRRRAGELLDRRGRLRGSFEPSLRSDEIGDLERALAELTRRLEQHLQFTEAFAADVSHEFKNPLASIRTATDMALDEHDPAQRSRFLNMIQRDVARMERLLTEAREISWVDARLDEEERERVAVDAILAGLIESFRLRLGDEGPEFSLRVADGGAAVFASADRLTQVFENLIANAVSFSPSDGTISVSVRRVDNLAEIVVSDSGPGIPAEHLDRIFSRFFSYRPSDDKSGHTGLGLSLVKAIVEGYGGKVAARTRRGGGASFVVELPLADRG
jgi:two-component system sensor histidine kinase ChvG